MSLLTRLPSRSGTPQPVDPTGSRLRSPLAVGALAGLQAAGGGLFAVVAGCLLVWIAAPRVGATWVEAFRVAADAWLVAHGATLVLEAGEISVVPLGLTLLPLALCWSAGRRAARALEVPAGGVPLRAALVASAGLVGVYAALAVVVAVVAATPVAHPAEGQAALGGLVVAALGAAVGIGPALRPRPSVPTWVSLPLRAAAVAVTAWLGASALLLAVALVLGWSRSLALADALGAGAVGGAGLLVLQLALLPVGVVWCGAWLAGPGFAVGTGSVVSPAATSVGVLPALPVLGALPDPGAHPGWAWLAVGVPVLAGVLAGRSVRRGAAGAPLVVLRSVVLTAALTGAAAAVLALWSSGAVGSGRMADLGPSPLWVGLAVGGEVLAGCLIGVLLPGRSVTPAWLPTGLGRHLPGWLHRPLSLRPSALVRRPASGRRPRR